ncbi:MAG: ABC transporter permease subunit [Pseudomonadota bacterium]
MSIQRKVLPYLPSLIPGAVSAVVLCILAVTLLLQLTTLPEFDKLSLGARFGRTLFWTSLQASLSTIGSIIVGVALAWALYHRARFPGRSLLIALLSSALVLPTLVVVLGLVSVLGRSGWLNDLLNTLFSFRLTPFIYGLDGIVIAHCYFNASFAARALLTRLNSIPEEQMKLSASLGLSAWQRLRLVEWPYLSTSIPALATTIFLLCFTSFAIVLTLGGSPKYNTLEVSIFEAIKLDYDLGRALGLALIQLAICALLVIATSRTKLLDHLTSTPADKQPIPADARITVAIQWVVIAVFSLFFLLPLLAVVIDGLTADWTSLLTDSLFIRATLTSLIIATISAVCALSISFMLAQTYTTLATSQRLGNLRVAPIFLRLLNFSATLYLAVPALVLGFSFFLLARNFGGPNQFWATAAIVTANVLMVLPFALVTLAPAAVKAANRYDRLTASLGLRGYRRFTIVESSLMRSELVYVASIAFCMSLGDLGVIALFGSQDFATLPWLLYQKMGAYRTTEAAGIAAFMLIITLLVFLAAPRLLVKNHAATR